MSGVVGTRDIVSNYHAELRCTCGHEHLDDLGPCRRVTINNLSGIEATLSGEVAPGRLYRCRRCFLALRLPRPGSDVLEQIYLSIPAGRWSTDLSEPQRYVAQHVISGMQLLRINRVLDVGAFTGNFLNALPSGLEKCAIEPSYGGQEQLAKHRISLLKPFLADACDNEKSSFDVVTMFDVFEHLPDPIAGMRSLMSYVRPGGMLIISTGNMDHWTFRMLRGNHWYFDPIQHIAVGGVKHFHWLKIHLRAETLSLAETSHQRGTSAEKILQTGETFYFATRTRYPRCRWAERAFHIFPFFRRISHRDSASYLMKLNDHIVAIFEKPDAESVA